MHVRVTFIRTLIRVNRGLDSLCYEIMEESRGVIRHVVER